GLGERLEPCGDALSRRPGGGLDVLPCGDLFRVAIPLPHLAATLVGSAAQCTSTWIEPLPDTVSVLPSREPKIAPDESATGVPGAYSVRYAPLPPTRVTPLLPV